MSLSGCVVAGGGWIESKFDPDDKATFGFEAACVIPEDEGDAGPLGDDGGSLGVAEGEFQYVDHGEPDAGADVRIHGYVDTAIAIPEIDAGDAGDFGLPAGDAGGFEICGYAPDDGGFAVLDAGGFEGAAAGFFSGWYHPQPKKIRGVPRATGYFGVYWEDTGEPPGLSDDDYLSIELFGGEFDGYYNSGELGGGNIDFEFLEPIVAN